MSKILTAILALGCVAFAQAPAEKAAVVAAKVDPELHRNAIKLVEASGGKQRMQNSLPQMVEGGKAQIRSQYPEIGPAFVDEWGKRMLARVNVNEFVEVAARAYEKYFTNAELLQILAAFAGAKDTPPIPVSAELQKKIAELTPKLMGDIVGGSAELGSRLGAEIGKEIESEHPEWMKKPASASEKK